VSYSDPFGLCPTSAGGDGKTDTYSDCPQGTSGYDAYQAQTGNGGLANNIAGAYHSCKESGPCATLAAVGGGLAGGWAAEGAAAIGGALFAGAEDAAGAIPVIGRWANTSQYIGQDGYDVLNLANWTPEANDAWINDIISNRRSVLTVTEQTQGNLWNAERGEWSQYAKELGQLIRAGYRQLGNILVPPTP